MSEDTNASTGGNENPTLSEQPVSATQNGSGVDLSLEFSKLKKETEGNKTLATVILWSEFGNDNELNFIKNILDQTLSVANLISVIKSCQEYGVDNLKVLECRARDSAWRRITELKDLKLFRDLHAISDSSQRKVMLTWLDNLSLASLDYSSLRELHTFYTHHRHDDTATKLQERLFAMAKLVSNPSDLHQLFSETNGFFKKSWESENEQNTPDKKQNLKKITSNCQKWARILEPRIPHIKGTFQEWAELLEGMQYSDDIDWHTIIKDLRIRLSNLARSKMYLAANSAEDWIKLAKEIPYGNEEEVRVFYKEISNTKQKLSFSIWKVLLKKEAYYWQNGGWPFDQLIDAALSSPDVTPDDVSLLLWEYCEKINKRCGLTELEKLSNWLIDNCNDLHWWEELLLNADKFSRDTISSMPICSLCKNGILKLFQDCKNFSKVTLLYSKLLSARYLSGLSDFIRTTALERYKQIRYN